jgi:hypothetical protein
MGKGEVRCDLGDFESTGDAATCDAVSAESCGGSASRALVSASISGCGVGLRPIFGTPAASVERSGLAEEKRRATAAWSGAPRRFALSLRLSLFLSLFLCPCLCQGVGWRFGLWALGPWIGDDVRRSDSGARTAQQQGRGRQETQCTGGGEIFLRCVSASALPRVSEIHDGDGKGAGRWGSTRRDERWTAACRSQHRLGDPVSQAVEKGEGRTCLD